MGEPSGKSVDRSRVSDGPVRYGCRPCMHQMQGDSFNIRSHTNYDSTSLPPYFVNWTLDIFLRFRWVLLFQFRWIQYGWLGWIFHTRPGHPVWNFSPEGVPHTFSVRHWWQWRHPSTGFSWDANTFSGRMHFQHSSSFSFVQSRLTVVCQIIAKKFHHVMTQLQQ